MKNLCRLRKPISGAMLFPVATMRHGIGLSEFHGITAASSGFFMSSVQHFIMSSWAGSRKTGRFVNPVDQPVQFGTMIGLLVSGLKTLFTESVMTNSASSAIALKISDISVRQDSEGRYCLNDLHKASGNSAKHKPSEYLRNQQAKDLIAEIELEAGNPAIKTIKGRGLTGTYVVKELVYAYAMWISAKFHIAVIRAYDAIQDTQEQAQPKLTQEHALDWHQRLLVSIEHGAVVSTVQLEKGACVINPEKLVSVKTLITEFIPLDMMTDVIDIANKRLASNFPSKSKTSLQA